MDCSSSFNRYGIITDTWIKKNWIFSTRSYSSSHLRLANSDILWWTTHQIRIAKNWCYNCRVGYLFQVIIAMFYRHNHGISFEESIIWIYRKLINLMTRIIIVDYFAAVNYLNKFNIPTSVQIIFHSSLFELDNFIHIDGFLSKWLFLSNTNSKLYRSMKMHSYVELLRSCVFVSLLDNMNKFYAQRKVHSKLP